MSANAVSEPKKVTTSIAYADCTPPAAITKPASAGPTIPETLINDQEIAVAALSSSRSTSRGSNASKGGRSTALAAANSVAATYNNHSCGEGASALMSSAADTNPDASSAPKISLRRSKESASAPPISASATIGMNCATPSSPTATVEPVRS